MFSHATVVDVPQAIDFTLTRPTTATVSGVVDQRQYRHQTVPLCACRHAVGAGTQIGFGAGAAVPTSLAMAPSPTACRGTRRCRPRVPTAPIPSLSTYGIIIATFFGAVGRPHIRVRFNTNPDGDAARRTTLIVLLLLSTFYLFPAVLAVLTRAHAPQLYLVQRLR